MPSHLPPLRPVGLGVTRQGIRITGMVLARSSDLPALKSSILEMTEALKPAEPAVIASLLARLFSHYPQQQGGNAMTAAEDWIEDMRGVSATAFQTAVETWRRSPNAFKPSPGQLLAMIERMEAPLRERLATAQEIEAREEGMTTRERIAHLRHRQYELEMGMVPFEVHQQGHDEIQRYLARETAQVEAEIQHLEKGA